MPVNKIPLEKRLARIRKGYVSDPDYIPAAIWSMAEMPVEDYLAAFPDEKAELVKMLKSIRVWRKGITFQEVARHIRRISTLPGKGQYAGKAARLLAAPLIAYWNKGVRGHG